MVYQIISRRQLHAFSVPVNLPGVDGIDKTPPLKIAGLVPYQKQLLFHSELFKNHFY